MEVADVTAEKTDADETAETTVDVKPEKNMRQSLDPPDPVNPPDKYGYKPDIYESEHNQYTSEHDQYAPEHNTYPQPEPEYSHTPDYEAPDYDHKPDDYGKPGKYDYGKPDIHDYGKPGKYDYGTPDKHDYGTPDKHDYGKPGKYDYGTPDKHDYGTPDKHDYGTPEKYDYGTPDKYDYGKPYKYDYGKPGGIYPPIDPPGPVCKAHNICEKRGYKCCACADCNSESFGCAETCACCPSVSKERRIKNSVKLKCQLSHTILSLSSRQPLNRFISRVI